MMIVQNLILYVNYVGEYIWDVRWYIKVWDSKNSCSYILY